MLRNSFDANHGDGGDHAAILAIMQRKVLDGRAEMSVEDLRKVFDHLTTCKAAIVRTGSDAINEKTRRSSMGSCQWHTTSPGNMHAAPRIRHYFYS